jgi:predicted dehydrogenase
MATRLRVGIVGLGRRWRRLQADLAELDQQVEVRAVFDPVPKRAERLARELRCRAPAGVLELLESDDVEALLLLDAGWLGLWPLRQACRLGKPAFCAFPLARDPATAQALPASSNVLVALTAGLAPALVRLRRLMHEEIGPARLIRCERLFRGRLRPARPGEPPELLRTGAILEAFAGLSQLAGRAPTSVWTTLSEDHTLANILLELGHQQLAQVTLAALPNGPRAARFAVEAERGRARISLPGRVHWQDGNGQHRQRFALRPSLGAQLLQRLVRGFTPNLAEAQELLAWQQAVLLSWREQRRVTLAPGGGPR